MTFQDVQMALVMLANNIENIPSKLHDQLWSLYFHLAITGDPHAVNIHFMPDQTNTIHLTNIPSTVFIICTNISGYPNEDVVLNPLSLYLEDSFAIQYRLMCLNLAIFTMFKIRYSFLYSIYYSIYTFSVNFSIAFTRNHRV